MPTSEDSARRGSVAPRRAPAPSPFDGLKLELGMVLVVAACAGLATVAMDAPGWMELLGVTAVGFGCGGWIALRTRRVARSLTRDAPDTDTPSESAPEPLHTKPEDRR